MTATRALEITKTGIRVEQQEGQATEIEADTVVLCVGARSDNALADRLRDMGIAFSIAGDAENIGMAFDAVHKGYAAGSRIE
jgi:2,4-dienoyl-CoA reductase (NADPH2)